MFRVHPRAGAFRGPFGRALGLLVGASALLLGSSSRPVLAPASAQEPAPGASGVPEGSWPIFRGTPGLRGVAPGSLPDEPALLWRYEAGGAITSSATVVEGRVYFGADDQKLHAVDLETGKGLWTFLTDDIIEAPPLVHDGVVYVGSQDFFFYAVDAVSGELRWKHETDDKLVGSANVFLDDEGRGRIVVGSYDNRLYCFDAKSGELLWTYETDNYINGTPAIEGGRIVFGGCDAGLHVVSTKGERLAKMELGSECYVAGSVALLGDRAYFGHYGNQFVAVDLEKQEVVWSYDSERDQPFFASPAISGDRIVFAGRDKKIHCARLADGTPLWSFTTRRKIDSSPVICGERVVFGSADGRVYLLDLASGEERWSYEIGRAILSSPAVVSGRILIGSADGGLYAFGKPKTEERG